jgi:hypothetical protein
MLARAAHRLGPLLEQVTFVGGQVAELLITDPAAARIRPTDDVDVIVAVTTRSAYDRLGARLRAVGFQEDRTPGAPLCRWRAPDGVVLDVMPIEEAVLGFSNRWYPMGLATAMPYDLGDGVTLRIVSAPVFLATKWVAFDQRGAGDHLGSRDVEDILAVVAGRPELAAEVRAADGTLRRWLAERTRAFLSHPDSADALAGALPDARFDRTLLQRVRQRLEALTRGSGAPPAT